MLPPCRNPYDGTAIIIMEFGDWTPESGCDLIDSYTTITLAFDYVLQNPQCQLNGFRIIFNFKRLGLRYLEFLQPDAVRVSLDCSARCNETVMNRSAVSQNMRNGNHVSSGVDDLLSRRLSGSLQGLNYCELLNQHLHIRCYARSRINRTFSRTGS